MFTPHGTVCVCTLRASRSPCPVHTAQVRPHPASLLLCSLVPRTGQLSASVIASPLSHAQLSIVYRRSRSQLCSHDSSGHFSSRRGRDAFPMAPYASSHDVDPSRRIRYADVGSCFSPFALIRA